MEEIKTKREIGNRRYDKGDYVGAYRFYSDGLQCLALMDEEEQLAGKSRTFLFFQKEFWKFVFVSSLGCAVKDLLRRK